MNEEIDNNCPISLANFKNRQYPVWVGKIGILKCGWWG